MERYMLEILEMLNKWGSFFLGVFLKYSERKRNNEASLHLSFWPQNTELKYFSDSSFSAKNLNARNTVIPSSLLILPAVSFLSFCAFSS